MSIFSILGRSAIVTRKVNRYATGSAASHINQLTSETVPLPMAVYSFFDEYDFSGKTIIPFNVHNGSRFSRTIQTIEELEPDATVIENGFTVNERDVADAAGDVASWLQELGY